MSRPEMRPTPAEAYDDPDRIPNRGDRIEHVPSAHGVSRQGTVFHVDQFQIFVKWDDGRSESLRPGVDRFRIVDGR
jgi:Domain of unknown function (DUF4314)